MTLDEIVKQLQKVHLPTVARVSGLHYNQVWRLKIGKDKNPQTKTVVALSDALKEMKNGDNSTQT